MLLFVIASTFIWFICCSHTKREETDLIRSKLFDNCEKCFDDYSVQILQILLFKLCSQVRNPFLSA